MTQKHDNVIVIHYISEDFQRNLLIFIDIIMSGNMNLLNFCKNCLFEDLLLKTVR